MPHNPSEKQKLALHYLRDKETQYVGYGGAGFGGKSYLGCKWVTTMCVRFAGVGYAVARNVLVELKKTTLITLYEVFAEHDILEGRDYTFDGQLSIFTFTNGSQIFLMEIKFRPSDILFRRLGSFNLTGAFI